MIAGATAEPLWAVVPAAGRGERMASALPKQYLPLAGRTVIEHSLRPLVEHVRVEKVCVAVRRDDPYWTQCPYHAHAKVLTTLGGEERFQSVLHALEALSRFATPSDWVLVHDAVRPCLPDVDLERLVSVVGSHPVGGLLAGPINDTVKQAVGTEVVCTVERTGLWRAFTPQMFRLGALRDALAKALSSGVAVTDEAQAMERVGLRPMIVEGSPRNVKLTRPDDVLMAALWLEGQPADRDGGR